MIEDPKFKEAWKEFVAMRKKKRRPMTKGAEERQMKKAIKVYEGLNKNVDNLVSHILKVCDSMWDNVYKDEEHLNNIISEHGTPSIKPTGSRNNTGTKATGTNYFTYQKDGAYFAVAERLRIMCEGFDFVSQLAAKQL